MDNREAGNVTRREVLIKASIGALGVLLLRFFPRIRKETEKERFLKNISDVEASYYKRLAG